MNNVQNTAVKELIDQYEKARRVHILAHNAKNPTEEFRGDIALSLQAAMRSEGVEVSSRISKKMIDDTLEALLYELREDLWCQ